MTGSDELKTVTGWKRDRHPIPGRKNGDGTKWFVGESWRFMGCEQRVTGHWRNRLIFVWKIAPAWLKWNRLQRQVARNARRSL